MSDDKIDALLEQRGQQWGDAVITHADIATVWSGILGHEVTALEVALCMTGLKLVRARINPTAKDSYDDGHGYLKIAEWIVFDGRDPRVEPKPDIPGVKVCLCHGVPLGFCGSLQGVDENDPIPYTLADELGSRPIKVDLEKWVPGDDVDDDALVREELEWHRKRGQQ